MEAGELTSKDHEKEAEPNYFELQRENVNNIMAEEEKPEFKDHKTEETGPNYFKLKRDELFKTEVLKDQNESD